MKELPVIPEKPSYLRALLEDWFRGYITFSVLVYKWECDYLPVLDLFRDHKVWQKPSYTEDDLRLAYGILEDSSGLQHF